MRTLIGTRIDHFEITAKLGEGGMGVVYRAQDTELGREVAIKVLPQSLVADPDRSARFEREAKLLASLNHPHIAQIYGLASEGATRGLVMELVEGPTLAERLEEGGMLLDDALRVAKQIAEALEEAHERGIVHRDLKPQNIKLTADGQVKVLDFGLAKALDPMASGTSSATQIAHSPTLTMQATMQGVILGTAAYMSPEQAAGRQADRRADIWSFGAVLYEMLAGRQLFQGESVSHVLAGVLKEEPDFETLPESLPPRIRRLLRRCLTKTTRQRLQAIGDARVVLEEVLAGADDEDAVRPAFAEPAAARSVWFTAIGLLAAAAFGALVAWALLGHEPPRSESPRALAELSFPLFRALEQPRLSPDGTRLSMTVWDASTGLWAIAIRTLATGDVRVLPGTESGQRSFWSPDSQSLGFYSNRNDEILRVDLEGGRPVRLAYSSRFNGATWGPSDILFANQEGLYRIPPSGGEPTLVRDSKLSEGRLAFFAPEFLPDGRHFTYARWTGREDTMLHLASMDSEQDLPLIRVDSRGIFVDGRLLYLRGGTLLARTFDVERAELGPEDAEIIAQGVGDEDGGAFSMAAGLLVYQSGGDEAGSQILVYDRDGRVERALASDTFLDDLTLAPDDRTVALMRNGTSEDGRSSGADVWTLDLERDVFNRVTYEMADDPAFSPDGKMLAFAHSGDLLRKAADGTGEAELLVESPNDIVTNQWTADGWIVYSDLASGNEDLFAVAADGGEPRTLTSGPYRELHGQVSPDGRYLAYTSTESGEPQVYLSTWPEIAGKWRVSKDASAMPRWRGDSRELYMVTQDKRLTRVTVSPTPGDPRIGVPEDMFPVALDGGIMARTHRWDVTSDGKRFLVLAAAADEANRPAVLYLMTLPGFGGG